MKKGSLLLVLLLFVFFNSKLFSKTLNIGLVQNSHFSDVDEQNLIRKVFEQKLNSSDYYLKSTSSSEVDVNALFFGSTILADSLLKKENTDFLLIPASVKIDEKLTRVRLMIYSKEGGFKKIFDTIKSSTEAEVFLTEHYPEVFTALNLKESEDSSTLPRPLIKRENKGPLLITTDGRSYNAVSSDIGDFKIPFYIESYTVPSSISFSLGGFDTLYVDLASVGGALDVSLKPSFVSNEKFYKPFANSFYSAVTLTLSAFAVDLAARSFRKQGGDLKLANTIQSSASNFAYFSLGLLFYTLIDYYFASSYAFK